MTMLDASIETCLAAGLLLTVSQPEHTLKAPSGKARLWFHDIAAEADVMFPQLMFTL